MCQKLTYALQPTCAVAMPYSMSSPQLDREGRWPRPGVAWWQDAPTAHELARVANERPWVYRAAEWPRRPQHGRWGGRYCVSSTARAGQAAGGAKQRGPRPNARYTSLAFYALHRRVAAAPVATSRPRSGEPSPNRSGAGDGCLARRYLAEARRYRLESMPRALRWAEPVGGCGPKGQFSLARYRWAVGSSHRRRNTTQLRTVRHGP